MMTKVDNLDPLTVRGRLFLQDRNYEEAFTDFQSAASKGSGLAMAFVGWMFETGKGRSRDLKEAESWYRKSVGCNSAVGRYYLAILMLDRNRSVVEALEELQKSANAEFSPALYRLGLVHLMGEGVKVDDELAMQCFRNAAERGHVFSQALIAKRMIKGRFGFINIPNGIIRLVVANYNLIRIAIKDIHDERLFK